MQDFDDSVFTEDQLDAMKALRAGHNVFLSGNAGTGKSFVLNAFLDELEQRNVSYLAMAPTGIAAQNLTNGTTIHRTLQINFGILDPNDRGRKVIGRKVLNKAEVIIIDEISMCRVDLFERVMTMILSAKRVSGPKQVVVVGDFFQLPPVVKDEDRSILMQWWPGNDDGYAFKSDLWAGMDFEPHILKKVVRQSDPEFIGKLNHARIGNKDCVKYFNQRSVSDRKHAPVEDLWLCATNRMATTINDERVSELAKGKAKAHTYVAKVTGDVKPSDKPTEDKLRLIEGARVMLLANMPDEGLSNGSLGTVVAVECDSATVDFDDGDSEVEIEPKEWEVLKSTVGEVVGEDGKPVQKIVNDVVGTFEQIPLRLAFAVTIHKSQGQTFERCAVHSKVFGAGMLYVALSRCTTFDGLTVWPKIETNRLRANQAVIDFYHSLEAKTRTSAASIDSVLEPPTPAGGMVEILCPEQFVKQVQGYIQALSETAKVVQA